MRLFIRIIESPTTDPKLLENLEWLLLDRQDALVSHGSGDLATLARLVDLKSALDPEDVVLLIPAEHCLSIRCTVPGRTVGQMRRALPYAVEEFIADDIDTMHLAVAAVKRNEPVDTVLIDRELLSSWLASLASHGVVPGHALPDTALLPQTPGTVAVLFDDQRVLIRAMHQMAAAEAATLPLALQSLVAAAGSAPLQVLMVNGNLGRTARAAVEQAGDAPIDWVELQTEVTPLAYLAAAYPAASGSMNLLQGSYAPVHLRSDAWVRWRGVAALLGIWFVVLLGSETVTGLWADYRAETLSADVDALYREFFPNDRRVLDPYKQMAAHLGASAAAGPSFLNLLASLGEGLAAEPTAALHSVSFNDGRSELGAEVAVAGFDALEKLKNAWAKTGVAVEIASADQQGAQVQARIRLRSP